MRRPMLPILGFAIFFSFLAGSTSGSDEALVRLAMGGATIRDGSDTLIRMESERVVIEVGVDSYTVDAEFSFFNSGLSMTETVGFPIHAWGDPDIFVGAESPTGITTWVNGERQELLEVPGYMKVIRTGPEQTTETITDTMEIESIRRRRRAGLKTEVLPLEETRWLVKDVTFPSGTTTTTRIHYSAEYVDRWYTYYYYGSGASSSGTIGQAVFILRWSPEVWPASVPYFGPVRPSSPSHARVYEIQRTGEFEVQFIMRDIEPENAEAMTIYVPGPELADQPWELHNAIFHYSNREVPDALLEIMSFHQLDLFVQAIQAYRGRIFESPELDAYFRARDWYVPRQDYRDEDLTPIDRLNIGNILAYSRSLRERLGGKEAR